MASIQDAFFNVVGSVDDTGTVRNRFNQIVGQVSLGGVVTNASGRTVGYVDGSTIYNSVRDYVGYDAFGTIQNRNSSTVGHGDLFDSSVYRAGAALLLLL